MDRRWLLAVTVGGTTGALARWALLEAIGTASDFPWAVLVVNLLGCGALGLLLAVARRGTRHRVVMADLLGMGFCGGFTTMSTFAVEVVDLARAGRPAIALAYASVSVAGGLLAAWLGGRIGVRLELA